LIEKRNEVEEVVKAHQKVKDEHTGLETKLTTDEELLQTLLTVSLLLEPRINAKATWVN
jgi:hypothetical protein